jgi:hypothetical protein
MSTCPTDESLRHLGTLSMSDGDFLSLEKHIQDCVDCQAELERLAGEGSSPRNLAAGFFAGDFLSDGF